MSRFIAPRPNTTALLLRASKPRNPLVGPAHQRLAGKHHSGNARQQAARELREHLKLDSP